MEPKLIERGEMLLVGAVGTATSGQDIHRIWEQFIAEESAVEHTVPGVHYELQLYPEGHRAGEPFTCLAGVEVTQLAPLPTQFFAKTLAPARYAVFAHKCAEGYDRINREIDDWLAASAYRAADRYSLQTYDARFRGMEDPSSEQDIWVPLVARE